MTKIASTLPGGDANGLVAIARALIDSPHDIHVVVALVDCKKTTTDNDTGAVVARPATPPRSGRDAGRSSGGTADARDRGYDPRTVRAWARDNNIPCPRRGPLPARIVDAWRDAQKQRWGAAGRGSP